MLEIILYILLAYFIIICVGNIFCLVANLYMASKIIFHNSDKTIKYVNRLCKYNNVIIIINIFTVLVFIFISFLPIS